MAGDTVIISSAAAIRTVWVITAQNRLEVSAGMHRRTLRGIGRGFLFGAATGAAIGLLTYREPDCSQSFVCLDFGPGFAALAGAVVLGVPGMVIGAIAGAHEGALAVPLHLSGARPSRGLTPA